LLSVGMLAFFVVNFPIPAFFICIIK
jgi:hypothetical protein